MWCARLAVLQILTALLLMQAGEAAERQTLRADYDRARSSLVALGSGAEEALETGAALDRVWSAVANWTAGFLDVHPGASAWQVAKDVERLDPERRCTTHEEHCDDDYQLTATTVRLDGLGAAAFVVAANYPKGGAIFVVARGSDGHFRAAWNIRDLARRHFASRDEIGYWAWTRRGWGDGPLRGRVGPLPRAASGQSRFYIDAVAAAAAGGTYNSQFSVWEWSGSEARALFIESYQVSFDTAAVTVKDGVVSIPTKGSYKSFLTCGSCPEPHVLRRLRVAADGVHDLGKSDVEREARCVDELWDRLIHGRPANALAAPRVVAALEPLVQEVKHDLGANLDKSLGMLERSALSKKHGQRYLLIGADRLDPSLLRFEIGSSNGGVCLRNVRIVHPLKPVRR